MKILMLANELRYSCGVTNHLLHLCKSLSENNKINIYIICGGGDGIGRFDKLKVNIIFDERFLHRNRSIKKYISAIIYLNKFANDNNINIIHSHTHYGASIASKASKWLNIKTVQTNHGILKTRGILKHFNAEYYIAINEHIYNYIIKRKIADQNNLKLIRCGINVNNNFIEKSNNTKIKVISSGRFVKEKGFDIFIKAVNKLPDEIFAKADFYISGIGEIENELKEINITLGGKVNFLGNIENMNEFLNSVHIFVYCSVSDSEGFPAVITESGSSGCVLISSNFIGSEYILKDKINSVIYNKGNYEELRNKLMDVILNYENYKQYAKLLYELIKKEYSVSIMAEKHIRLYEQCLKK